MTLGIGWHKDKWMDIDNIQISANDRGLKFGDGIFETVLIKNNNCLLYTSPSPRDKRQSRMPSSA